MERWITDTQNSQRFPYYTRANADEVGEVGKEHQAVLMENHGVICWGKDVEDAYWKMENIDSYCRTVWIAAGLGGGLREAGDQPQLIPALDGHGFDVVYERTSKLSVKQCALATRLALYG